MKRIVPILFAALALLLVLGGCDFLPGPPDYYDMNNPLDKYSPGDENPPADVTALSAYWQPNSGDVVAIDFMLPADEDVAGVEIDRYPTDNWEEPMRVPYDMTRPIPIGGLNTAQGYTFTLRTFDFNENMSAGVTVAVPAKGTIAPLPVTGLTAEYDQVLHQINVNWQNPTDYVAGFTTISISTNSPTTGEAITVEDGSTQAVIPISQFGMEYVVIATVQRDGMTSVETIISVDVPALPSTEVLPVNAFYASYNQALQQITVNWQNPSDYVAGATTILIWTNPTNPSGIIQVSDGSTGAVIPIVDFGISYTVIATVQRNSMISVQRTSTVDVPALDPLRQGLVGEWLFENGSLNDTSGNTNPVSNPSGTVSADVDRFNISYNAMHVLSAGSLTASSAPLPSGSAPRTLSAWVKLDAYPASDGVVFQYGDTELVVDTGGFLGTWVNGILTYCTDPSTKLSLNTWYHLALVYDGGNLTIVVNSLDAGNWPASLNTTVGYGLTMATNMLGSIDDVRIYNRVLIPAEVDQLHRMQGYYDIASDYSSIPAGTGPWSFWMTMNPGVSYTQMDVVTTINGYPAFRGLSDPPTYAWMNTGAVVYNGIGSGGVALVPQYVDATTYQMAVLRWTAPKAGTFRFRVTFNPSPSTTTIAHIYRDNALNDEFNLTTPMTRDITLSFIQGDTVNFVVEEVNPLVTSDTLIDVTFSEQ